MEINAVLQIRETPMFTSHSRATRVVTFSLVLVNNLISVTCTEKDRKAITLNSV